MAGDFSIDTDELDAVIRDLQACETRLESLTDDLDRQVAALHGGWEGLAADAQLAAHREWSHGMREMRAALTRLRAAADTAGANYRSAAETNLRMWQQIL